MHLRALLGLAVSIVLWLPTRAQTGPDQLGPGDAYEREISRQMAAEPARAADLIKEAARRRAARDGLDETHALIVVRRKLAAIAETAQDWSLAESHLGAALDLEALLEEAGPMIELSLARSRVRLNDGNRVGAMDDAKAAWDLARRVGRPPAQVEAGLLLARLFEVTGRPQYADPYFEAMMALPGVDQPAIAVKQAEIAAGLPDDVAVRRWQAVADLARQRGAADLQARALDELGWYATRRQAWPEALRCFREADARDAARPRSAAIWSAYSKTLAALGEPRAARTTVEHALQQIDVNTEPGRAADLEDSRATLLAQLGEPAGAYAALRRAEQLRRRAANTGFTMMAARMVPPTATADNEQASALAAARNALRDAELARTQLKWRAAAGLALSGVVVAGALALAYVYKRRAARALAAARDAAELRAERTHWQMLRYQLNPHFLFNALTSLSGLIAVDPPAARRVVGRLSDFCRAALQRTTGDLRTVDDEMQLLTAYVDVERAGAGDELHVTFEIDPAARAAHLPPLLLQPLVENALKYGDAAADGVRRVVVAARRDGPGLVLEVSNTGAWIDQARPNRRPERGGVGLDNVRERLARIGPGASLESSAADGWVQVRVTLPELTAGDLPRSSTRPA